MKAERNKRYTIIVTYYTIIACESKNNFVSLQPIKKTFISYQDSSLLFSEVSKINKNSNTKKKYGT